MSRRQIQAVILREDRTHEVFVRRYLERAGYEAAAKRGKVKAFIAPPGRGSGEQFVLERYAQFLAEFRAQRNPQFHRLVAVIDADAGTVGEHEAQLAAAAVRAELLPRQRGEGIVHLIPKRNVETWIHRLLGNDADEMTDYKLRYTKQPKNDYCRPAAEALVALVRDANQMPDLPFLRVGVDELRDRLSGG